MQHWLKTGKVGQDGDGGGDNPCPTWATVDGGDVVDVTFALTRHKLWTILMLSNPVTTEVLSQGKVEHPHSPHHRGLHCQLLLERPFGPQFLRLSKNGLQGHEDAS